MDIKVSFDNEVNIGVDFNNGVELSNVFDIRAAVGGKYPAYTGATEIIPAITDQILETEKKSLETDITVKKVPTEEVRNDAGGYTFSILS